MGLNPAQGAKMVKKSYCLRSQVIYIKVGRNKEVIIYNFTLYSSLKYYMKESCFKLTVYILMHGLMHILVYSFCSLEVNFLSLEL